MGVPGFFISLCSKFTNTKFVFSKSDLVSDVTSYDHKIDSINELYLDANCLIHPVCFKVYNENKLLSISNPIKLEEKMIKEVILYIELIINYVNPNNLVYIAIDGVAPMAKIKHQRIRRFKSIIDNELKENIAKKHHIEYIKPWNNSAITPGTEFMAKLTNAIVNYINLKKQNNITNPNKVNYIFSTANSVGEGEHKILQYIRSNLLINKTRIIYGLDADLLYLALASQASNIYLLREVSEFQNMKSDDLFCYVSIDVMKDCIFQDISNDLECINKIELKERFIQDYIFMGFLLGNDFLPALPSVNLLITKKNLSGLEILLRVYQEVFTEINKDKLDNYEFLVQINPSIKISYNFITKLFLALKAEEEPYFRAKYKIKKFIRPFQGVDEYNLEIYNLENLMFKIPDLFELGKSTVTIESSKIRYYKHYYPDQDINPAINDYFKGLYWNLYYYFDKCPDYKFYYTHHKAPFVSDIYNWIVENETIIEEMDKLYPTINDYYKIIKPIQQLLMVLPIQSAYLLPKNYKNIMIELPEYYPKDVKQDYQLITRYWQALPEIKIIEPDFIWSKIKDIKLTDKENDRNKFKKVYELIV